MKQTLSMRLGQQLAMTPQLQQAIRLMQLSALELRTEVHQAVETNPMLELVEDVEEDRGDDQDEPREEEAEFTDGAGPVPSEADVADDAFDGDETPPVESLDAIPDDLPVDVSWDEVYQPAAASGSDSRPLGEPDERSFDERNSLAETLLDHLRWQLNLTRMSDRDRLAADVILDAINDDGMLTASIEDLLAAVHPALGFEPDEMEAVLKLVQHFDPPGIAARDLSECLFLQLEQLPAETPWRREAIDLVLHHFHLIAKRDFAVLARRTKLGQDELVETMTLIRSLNPRPGSVLGDAEIEYMQPDVFVVKHDGRWTVQLNGETAPRLRVNNAYAQLVKRTDTSKDGQYLKDSLQDAKWFLKNLEYRNETLLKVAAQIVKRQQGFLEHGEQAMQPLVLADIAVAVDRHESTISRVTTRKYMDTPRGIFELKYFFSSHVADANGTEISSTAIRAHIKKLCAEEDPRKPLSDNKITAVLKARNINVARRTVAKYRESMAIPPSNERKRLV